MAQAEWRRELAVEGSALTAAQFQRLAGSFAHFVGYVDVAFHLVEGGWIKSRLLFLRMREKENIISNGRKGKKGCQERMRYFAEKREVLSTRVA